MKHFNCVAVIELANSRDVSVGGVSLQRPERRIIGNVARHFEMSHVGAPESEIPPPDREAVSRVRCFGECRILVLVLVE